MATNLEEKRTMKFGISNVVAWRDVAACLFMKALNITPFIWFVDVYINRNLTPYVNKKSQLGINSQT